MASVQPVSPADLVAHCELFASMGQALSRLLVQASPVRRGSALPQDVAKAPARQCFANAGRLVLARQGWTYCEGFAVSDKLRIPVVHAWCLDASGNVVDPTWETPESCSYLGIPYRRAYCEEHWSREGVWDIWSEMPSRSLRELSAEEAVQLEWLENQAEFCQVWSAIFKTHLRTI